MSHISGSDSDSDSSPEAVSLTQSKAGARRLNATLQRAEVALTRERKEKNRKRDEALKKRAVETKETRVTGSKKRKQKSNSDIEDDEDTRLQNRMARAMMEADEESDVSGDSWTGLGGDISEKGEGSSSGSESSLLDYHRGLSEQSGEDSKETDDEEAAEQVDDDSEEEEQEQDVRPPPRKRAKQLRTILAEEDYLPDHLFASALAKPVVTSREANTRTTRVKDKSQLRKKSKRKSRLASKDLIVGYVSRDNSYGCDIYLTFI